MLDSGYINFIVTYEDKTKAVNTFWSANEELLRALFRIVKKMVPSEEEKPEVLRMGDE